MRYHDANNWPLLREALKAMGPVLSVWQGHTTDRDDGWSWTLDLEKAEWFARRFASMEGSEPVLTHGMVAKADVVAYFTRRNEEEILVAPENVSTVSMAAL